MHQHNAITVRLTPSSSTNTVTAVRLTPSSSTNTVAAVRLKTEAVTLRSEAFNIVQIVYQPAACD
jgi:hypothetical protein